MKSTPCVGARPLTRSSPKIACSTIPEGVYRGRDEIDRVAGAVKATHPDFRYQPIAEPEELGNGGRIQWVSGRPGEAPAYAGTDFIIARDGRIAAVYLFFDKLPVNGNHRIIEEWSAHVWRRVFNTRRD